jgi:hypothetical protein
MGLEDGVWRRLRTKPVRLAIQAPMIGAVLP